MRTAIITVATCIFLYTVDAKIQAADLTAYEMACSDLGFKKRTPAYGECVLELDRRASTQQKAGSTEVNAAQEQAQKATQSQSQEQERLAKQGDGTEDHRTCYGFGFRPGVAGYAECRLKISIARKEAADREAAYEAEQRRYQAQMAEYERQKEKAREAAFVAGLARLAGVGGGQSGMMQAPTAPTPPAVQQYYITSPSGRSMACRFNNMNNTVSCF